MPELHVNGVEALWIVLNLTTFVLTASALLDARADREAVRKLNGSARELVAKGIVRREGLRLVVQVLLLIIVVPGVFADREFNFTPAIAALMLIPIVLLISSAVDARDRRALTVVVAADLLEERTTALDRLEQALTENTDITREASAHADAAYHEANSVNLKIADLNEALVRQGDEQASDRQSGVEVAEAIGATIEDTAEKVTDIHRVTVEGNE